MALSEQYQAELRSLLLGAGTDYPFISPIDGLFSVPLRTADVPAMDRTSPATDWLAARTLSWRAGIAGTSPDDASDLAQALATAWRRSSGEETLDLWIPGTDWERRFYGRPRLSPAAADLARLPAGWAAFELTFVCLDPLGYGPAIANNTKTGTFTIPADELGDEGADTDRVSLLFAGNDGTPKLVNNTQGGVLEFAEALGTGETASINLRTGAVVVEGSPAPEAIDASSTWMRLAGGVANSLTLTGAANVSVYHRAGFW